MENQPESKCAGIKRKSDDGASSTSSTTKTKKREVLTPQPPPAREVDMSTLEFLFEKKLQRSDIDGPNRIVIPKAKAQQFFPQIGEQESIDMFMDDVAATKVWTFRYRFGYWPNCGTKMFVLEKTAKYVDEYKLKVGDVIQIYRDSENGRYAIGSGKDDEKALNAEDDSVSNPNFPATSSCELFGNCYHPQFAPEGDTSHDIVPNDFNLDDELKRLNMTKEEFFNFNPFD